MRTLILHGLMALCLFWSNISFSQSDSLHRLRTRDGNEYTGKIVSQTTENIVVQTKNVGAVTINRADISSMELIDEKQMVKGEYWPDNPQNTRYFFAPTGYGLKKGEGYYQNVWVLYNQVAYGITDNFSLGAGTVPLFLFGEPTPVWLTAKLSFPVVKDKVYLGAGALAGLVIGAEDDNPSFGIMYGASTFGSRDRNVGFNIGWAFGGGEIAKSPTVGVNLLNRVSKTWYLLSENYYIGGSEDDLGILSFGARWVPRIIGIDFGFVLPVGPAVDGGTYPIPWLGISLPLGKGRKKMDGAAIKPFPAVPMGIALAK